MPTFWDAEPLLVLTPTDRIGMDQQQQDGTLVSGSASLGQIAQLLAGVIGDGGGGGGGGGLGIASATINADGHLIFTVSTGGTIDVGQARGAPGVSLYVGGGAPLASLGTVNDSYLSLDTLHLWGRGVSGWADTGVSIRGQPGPPGPGFTSATMDADGHLVLATNGGSTIDLGRIRGLDGAPGTPGAAGLGIANVSINAAGHLIITRTDSTTIDVGLISVGTGGAVLSVAGRTGTVTLTAADILGFVAAAAAAAPVQSIVGRTGAVTLAVADVSGAAPLASPALTGSPTAPTPPPGDTGTRIATMAAVEARIGALIGTAPAALDTLQEIAAQLAADETAAASLTTAVAGKQAALTVYDEGMPLSVAGGVTGLDFVGAGVTVTYANGKASVAIPAAPVLSVAGRGGAVTLAVGDVSGAAPLASPNFTGSPIAPTAATADSSTKLATTALVDAKISAAAPRRKVTGTADTPTTADDGGLIVCTSGSAVTITAADLGDMKTYSVMQRGAGAVTISAPAGINLVSDKAAASFTTARRGAVLTVICDGAGNVFVVGNTA